MVNPNEGSILDNPNLKGPFDQAKLDDARAELAKVRAKLDDASERYNDLYDKSHENNVAISNEDNQKLINLAMHRKTLQSQHDLLVGDVRAMEKREPATVIETKITASDNYRLFDKFLRAGSDQEKREIVNSDEFAGIGEIEEKGVVFNLKIPSLRELHSNRMQENTSGSLRSDNATGEDIVETDTMAEVIHRLLYFGDVAKVSRMINTGKGNPIEYPRVDNSTRKGRVLLNQDTETTHRPTSNFESTEVKVNTVASDRVRIAVPLIEDDIVDVVGIVWDELIRSMGRTKNEVFTDGLANSAFQGVAQVAKTGVTAAAQTTFTLNEIVRCMHSIDRAYRVGNEGNEAGRMKMGRGMNTWMVSDNFEEKMIGLLDLEGKPLWNPDTRSGPPKTIYGLGYVVNNDLDSVVASGVPALIGCFDHFLVRNSGAVRVFNFFDSNTATDYERELTGFCRSGSALVGPESATNVSDSIAKLVMAA